MIVCTVTPTVQDGTVVRWFRSEIAADLDQVMISASRNRVEIGEHLSSGKVPLDIRAAAELAAAALRSERQVTIPTRYGTETVWMCKERELLHRMVNNRRAELGLEEVAEDDVYAVEQSAAGHSDYADKFTLRLAFLAYGVEWKP